jgi:Domain of unknown function (DUF4118)
MVSAKSTGRVAAAAGVLGALIGLSFAWIARLVGLPLWGILILALSAAGIAVVHFLCATKRRPLPPLVGRARRLSIFVRLLLVAAMIGATLLLEQAFGMNPRQYGYSPLLPPVVISAVLLGFGPSMFAVLISVIAASYLYAPPVYSFAIAEWYDAAALAIFAALGGLCGLALGNFFDVPD